MTLLLDTDVFCKLGIAGLLEDAVALFGMTLKDCGRLPALPHMLRRGNLRKRFGADACSTLLPLAEQVPPIDAAGTVWLDRFVGIEAIDPGEAQLYALAAELQLTLLTGDKRALSAVKHIPEAAVALSGRAAVFESVLLPLCEQRGVDVIRTQVAVLIELDTMVQTCFSPRNADPCAGLASYLAAVTEEVHPLLLWQPGGSQ